MKSNATKENLLIKENEELKKKLEISEKVIDILNAKIECLKTRTDIMVELYEKVAETEQEYTDTLEKVLSEFID